MRKEVHLICNAHIDPIWQWDWQEGVSAVLSTFQSAVNLAEQFHYVFCHNEVTVYKYVEEYAPALFEKIKALVADGRWHIMGGWYLQPDCNMPSGESFVRQIQEGKRYFKEKFGVTPTTAINFDPFGHTVGLVQILKKCGQDSYIFMRPYRYEQPLPAEQFIWRGLDGSEVKANRARSYNSPLGRSAAEIAARAEAQSEKEETICVLWGVGNHGGGPSAKDLADIQEMMDKDEKFAYIHSTPEDFFKKIEPTAVVDTSLRISMPGCYTSMGKIKRKHALLENELWLTEKMLATAYGVGALKEYPEEKIHEIAQDILNAEFHDVLPGSSVQCGEENGLRLLDHGLLEAERLKTKAYFALLSSEDVAQAGEYPVVVFNPHPYPLTTNVECEFMLADQNWDRENVSKMRVYNEQGELVPYQVVKEESNLNLDWRKRVVFEAKLAPMQLSRFRVFVEFAKKETLENGSALVFDNGRKRVVIDENTGLLKEYTIDGVSYVKEGFLPVMFDDNPDPWGMGRNQLLRVGENESPFALSKTPSGVFEGMKSVQVIEDGDIYLGVEAFFENADTRVRVGYKIYKNNDAVDVDVTVFMGNVDKFVKVKLPISVDGTLVGQTAFGTEPLFMDARENVAQRFVAMEMQGGKCLAVMNTGTYGSHFEKGALYLSLVRGVTYCAHPIQDRPIIPTDRFVKKIDQGENAFSFRLDVVDRNRLERATQEFTQKPYALNVFPTKPERAKKTFTVALSDDTVSIVTMKKADEKDALLFRLLNNTADGVETALQVENATLPLSFGKFEVKTVAYENGALKELDELII